MLLLLKEKGEDCYPKNLHDLCIINPRKLLPRGAYYGLYRLGVPIINDQETFKDCQQKCKKKPSVMITWMSVDFYTKVLNSCRTLLESVQKPDLETVIDKVVKIYDALMYIQGEYKKAMDQNNQ